MARCRKLATWGRLPTCQNGGRLAIRRSAGRLAICPTFRARGNRPRRGLTLLELVVVLTILVALAGILVPMVSNLLPFTSSSAGATNATEVEKVVQLCLSLPQTNTPGQYNPLDLLDNVVSRHALLKLRAQQFHRHVAGYCPLHH